MMHNLRDIFMLDASENPSEDLEIAMESAMDENPGSMQEHLVELLYNELSYLGDDASAHKAFRFATIQEKRGIPFDDNPVIKDCLGDSLSFSNPVNFNDPMDPIVREWIDIQKKSSLDKKNRSLFGMVNKVIKSNLRIACLSTPSIDGSWFGQREPRVTDCSLLMWAHYAGMHKGICIEYDISDDALRKYNDDNHILRWCEVRYRNKKAMCSAITLDNALLAKADDWKYEKESRLIYFSKEKNDSDYITLPGFHVSAVYLGYRISSKVREKIRELLVKKGIPLYEMKFCREDLTKLEVRPIF